MRLSCLSSVSCENYRHCHVSSCAPFTEAEPDSVLRDLSHHLSGMSVTLRDSCKLVIMLICQCMWIILFNAFVFSALTCLLGIRKSIEHQACKEVLWWWHGYQSKSEVLVICTWTSWCRCHRIVKYFIQTQSGLPFYVRAYPDRLSWLWGVLWYISSKTRLMSMGRGSVELEWWWLDGGVDLLWMKERKTPSSENCWDWKELTCEPGFDTCGMWSYATIGVGWITLRGRHLRLWAVKENNYEVLFCLNRLHS